MEAKQSNLATATVAGGLLAAALVGIYELVKHAEHGHLLKIMPAATTAPGNPTTPPAPASSATPAPAGITAEQLAAQLAATRRAQDIDRLRGDLSGIWNQMDVLAVQLDSIKRQAQPPGYTEQVTADLFRACEATTAGSWFFGGLRCDGVRANVAAEVAKRWAVQISNQSQPYQAQLSELDNRQRQTVNNLAALGFTVPVQSVRSVTP